MEEEASDKCEPISFREEIIKKEVFMAAARQFACIFFATAKLSCGIQAASPTSEVSAEWIRVSPGKETECSDGTPYSFFIRAGQV